MAEITTNQVREAIEHLAAMSSAASITPETVASIFEMMRNLNDQEREKVIAVAEAKIREIQDIGIAADHVTLDSGATVEAEVSAIITELFPVQVEVVSSNADVREVGSSIIPNIVLNITRRGVDVAGEAQVTFTPNDGSLSQDHKNYTGAPIASGSRTYEIFVTQDGQTVSGTSQTFKFLNYLYRGVIDSKPLNSTAVKQTIEGSWRTNNKVLSNDKTLGKTQLAANKYYLFACKQNAQGSAVDLIVKNANSGGTISVPSSDKGSDLQISRVNGAGSDYYSWIIVPASPDTWYFQIVNN